MQNISLLHRKGMRHAVRCLNRAITEHSKEAQRRYQIIEFKNKYGAAAALEAFKISRSTLFSWQQAYKANGMRGLIPLSKAPLNKRRSKIAPSIKSFILEYRQTHPRVNQNTIKRPLDEYCKREGLKSISAISIARVIKQLKEEGALTNNRSMRINAKSGIVKERIHKYRPKLRRKNYQPCRPGDIVQIDSVHSYIDGIKRYIITAIDIQSRYSFAMCYSTLNSSNAADFMDKLRKVSPYEIKRVQTDNGLEFNKCFAEYLEKNNIAHYYNYPKSPKSNAYVERFNRTLREQFINVHRESFYDRAEVNQKLADYLIWYNAERVHAGLGFITPLDYILNRLNLNALKSNMYRYSTNY